MSAGRIVFTVMVKNAVFWDVTPCFSCKDQRFGETYRLYYQVDKNQRARNKLTILVTLMMEEIRSSETLVLSSATMRHIPEDGILHRHRP
jgi:hypothetical protein